MCPPPPWMNGRKRGVIILKNGGDIGKAGGKRISKTIELSFLKRSWLDISKGQKKTELLVLQVFRDRQLWVKRVHLNNPLEKVVSNEVGRHVPTQLS
jgi:hypothetical protein